MKCEAIEKRFRLPHVITTPPMLGYYTICYGAAVVPSYSVRTMLPRRCDAATDNRWRAAPWRLPVVCGFVVPTCLLVFSSHLHFSFTAPLVNFCSFDESVHSLLIRTRAVPPCVASGRIKFAIVGLAFFELHSKFS